jgi:hypothetical protein
VKNISFAIILSTDFLPEMFDPEMIGQQKTRHKIKQNFIFIVGKSFGKSFGTLIFISLSGRRSSTASSRRRSSTTTTAAGTRKRRKDWVSFRFSFYPGIGVSFQFLFFSGIGVCFRFSFFSGIGVSFRLSIFLRNPFQILVCIFSHEASVNVWFSFYRNPGQFPVINFSPESVSIPGLHFPPEASGQCPVFIFSGIGCLVSGFHFSRNLAFLIFIRKRGDISCHFLFKFRSGS